jgi:hypothetical protein
MGADRDINSHHVMRTDVVLRGATHGHNQQVFPAFVETDFDRQLCSGTAADKCPRFRAW